MILGVFAKYTRDLLNEKVALGRGRCRWYSTHKKIDRKEAFFKALLGFVLQLKKAGLVKVKLQEIYWYFLKIGLFRRKLDIKFKKIGIFSAILSKDKKAEQPILLIWASPKKLPILRLELSINAEMEGR